MKPLGGGVAAFSSLPCDQKWDVAIDGSSRQEGIWGKGWEGAAVSKGRASCDLQEKERKLE